VIVQQGTVCQVVTVRVNTVDVRVDGQVVTVPRDAVRISDSGRSARVLETVKGAQVVPGAGGAPVGATVAPAGGQADAGAGAGGATVAASSRLPSTGGVDILAIAAGIALVVGGLVARRIAG